MENHPAQLPQHNATSALARGDGSSSDTEIEAGDQAYAAERYRDAEGHYRAAAKLAPTDPAPRVGGVRAALALAQIEFDYAAAVDDARVKRWASDLELVTQKNPQYGPALLERGRMLLLLGQAEAAQTVLEGAVSLLSGDAEAHSSLGVARLALGKKAEALDEFKTAAALDPQSAGRFTNLGTAHLVLDHVNDALDAYQRALELAPNQARAEADVGTAYLAAERPAAALPHLLRATELAPRRATFVSNLGYCYQKQNQLDLAIRTYRRALALDPRLGSAWINLGTALAALNKLDAAEAAFKKALALDPTDPRPTANLRDLEALRKPNQGTAPTPGDAPAQK